ncbi:AMP-binding protein [Streptomyces violaceoruber]
MSFLHDLLTAQAASAPTRTAALLSDSSATYGQVETDADRVAAALVARGVRPGSRVGLHMSRSLALLPALFGILRAGGVCVPVDPEDPDERRATILEYSGATLVVTERALLDGPAPDGTRQLAVEDLLDEVAEPLTEPVELAPDALAFIFYTSGSTGTPKGVMLTHRALLSGQRWLQRTFPLEPGDRQLLRTTLSITNLVREVFWPVLSGGTVVIVPPGDHKDPDRLVELINSGSVTTLMVVPALLSGILENPGFAANTSLKYVFCSSDVMPGALPEKYFATGLSARLFNVYGLTEALYSTYWECLPGAVYDGFVPVGHPAELTPGSSTPASPRSRRARRASCAWPAWAWPRATTGCPGSPPRSSPTPRAAGCSAPATWPGSPRTAGSNSSAGWTTRSRSPVTGWSWARWRPGCSKSPASPAPSPPGCAARAVTSGWSPT